MSRARNRLWSLALLILLMLPQASAAEGESSAERSLRVSAVEIDGAWKTRESVVLHLLDLRPGDELTPAELLRGRERLLRSGFFHEVHISSRAGEARGEVILELKLRERHRPYLDTGFGYRDTGGWYLNLLSLRSENTLGLGGRSTLGFQLGFRTAGAALETLLPLRADASLALRLRLSALSEERLWYEEEPGWDGLFDQYRLKLNRSQADFGLEWRPRARAQFSLGISGLKMEPQEEGENRDLKEDVPLEDLPSLVVAEVEPAKLHGLTLGLRLGSGGMDGKPGRTLILSGRLVDEGMGSDRSFQRWSVALSSTHRLFAGHDLALGLRAGYISGDAPWYERFHLGGSYSLRGFRDYSLSPLDGHGSFWTASGEYRFPLTASKWTRLGGVVFFDAGRGRDLPKGREFEVDYDSLQMGMGYGVRYEIPWAGVLGFDVGFPVTRGVTGESTWYYLTLGHSF